MQKDSPHRRQRGFTIIEALIVLAIFYILATIAIPTYLNAQARARVEEARRNATAIATAVEIYRDLTGELPGELSALTKELAIRGVTGSPLIDRIPKPPKGWIPYEYASAANGDFTISTVGDGKAIIIPRSTKPPGS